MFTFIDEITLKTALLVLGNKCITKSETTQPIKAEVETSVNVISTAGSLEEPLLLSLQINHPSQVEGLKEDLRSFILQLLIPAEFQCLHVVGRVGKFYSHNESFC